MEAPIAIFRRAAVLALAITALLGLPIQVHEVHAGEFISGKGKFEYSLPFDGSEKRIPVYYNVPKKSDANTPVLFVMHGTNRDADRYRNEWSTYAERYNFIVVAPEFSRSQFPGANGYNLGNLFTAEDGKWQGLARSPYSVIEPLFDEFRAKSGVGREKYYIYGHSAGAQFVHRFVYMVPDARLEKAIAANAGWYTMPDLSIQWPYGLGGTGLSQENLDRLLAAPLVVLIGEKDNNPNHKSLRTTTEANTQGAHRFERGRTFFETGRLVAGDKEFGWQIGRVPGARHKNSQMAPAAIYIIVNGVGS